MLRTTTNRPKGRRYPFIVYKCFSCKSLLQTEFDILRESNFRSRTDGRSPHNWLRSQIMIELVVITVGKNILLWNWYISHNLYNGNHYQILLLLNCRNWFEKAFCCLNVCLSTVFFQNKKWIVFSLCTAQILIFIHY